MKKIIFTIIVLFSFLLLSSVQFKIDAEAYSVGDIIQFGSYPQSEVKDKTLILELNALAPGWEEWISYEYYIDETSGDWMKYIDLELNGSKYRGVKFTQYRPYWTAAEKVPLDNTYQDDNGYYVGTIYWFEYEPIDCRVLDPKTGLVMSEMLIDAQPYVNVTYIDSSHKYLYNDPQCTNYANDYKTSYIRQWLNNDFYNTAFVDEEKLEIEEKNHTISLLSYSEVSSHYGFRENYDVKRMAEGSDYAKCQGLYVYSESNMYKGYSSWRLAGAGINNQCAYVYYDGDPELKGQLNRTSYGIRPTFIISYVAQKHYIETVAKIPTCSESGMKEYTCNCGHSYTETIPATNHPNATIDPGKEPTTSEVGYTEGKYCPDCKTWIEGHEEIPKLHSHIYSSSTIIKEPTCTEEGIKKYICACGESYTMTLSKSEHVFRYVDVKKNATCTEPGLEWTFCDVCELEVEREIPAEGHNEYAYTRRATPAEAGAYVVACDKCWIEFSSISFGRPSEYKLSATKYTYNGKAKTPKLTVTTSDGKVLTKGVDYTVELPEDRTSVGIHTYRVVFMGDYLGEAKVTYQILPAKTSKITATQSTDSIKLTWKKVSGATGYRVYQYNSSTGKYKAIKTLTGTSYTVKNLKAGTTYKFAVKAYTKADGETLWAASSKTITTATKPATPTVKITAGSGKATLSWSKVSGATGYVIYMPDEFCDFEKVGSTTKTSYTKKGLKKGQTYKFRVRAYKKVDGKYIYSGYKTYSVKVK